MIRTSAAKRSALPSIAEKEELRYSGDEQGEIDMVGGRRSGDSGEAVPAAVPGTGHQGRVVLVVMCVLVPYVVREMIVAAANRQPSVGKREEAAAVREEADSKATRIAVLDVGHFSAKPVFGYNGATQYSLGAVWAERLALDERRTDDLRSATLKIAPFDFYALRVATQKSPRSQARMCREMTILQHRLSEWNASTADTALVVARVSTSLWHEFGKSCPDTFHWLARTVQWITIEAPWHLAPRPQLIPVDRGDDGRDGETKTAELSGETRRRRVEEEAELLDSTRRPYSDLRGGGPLGLPSMHTVPYPTGLRLESTSELSLLREFQSTRDRGALVALVLGEHARPGSTLRTELADACAKLGDAVCATDWRAARARLPRPDPNDVTPGLQLDRFAARLAFETSPHLALYANATFCLQPFGTTPTRGAFYQCLLAGGIPVVFEPFFAQALAPFLQLDHRPCVRRHYNLTLCDYHIRIDLNAALDDPFKSVFGPLSAVSHRDIAALRRSIARLAPRFQYATPQAGILDDAYETTLQRVIAYGRQQGRSLL